jgi:hypothetical protein
MSKLDDALQQLTDLQEREAQHARTMEQLIQQRDHYRELALQSGTMARSTQEIGLSPVKFVSIGAIACANILLLNEQNLNFTYYV